MCSYRFVSAFVYDLPFGSDQRFGGGLGGVARRLASGWQVNGILTFQSGYPLLMSQGVEQRQPVQPGAASELDGADATLNDQSRATPS